MARTKKSQAGFTFMELLVVAAVVMILLTVAMPAYENYSDRTDRARAIADLADISLKLTRWELNNGGLPADLEAAGLDGELDPWGRPYQYLRVEGADPGHVRKDHDLHPLNSDYDLYSLGPDGESTSPLTAEISRDDVLRANNGSYMGLASNYE